MTPPGADEKQRITFKFRVKNFGDVALVNVMVTDDLLRTFPPPVSFMVTDIRATNTLIINPAYNGNPDSTLLAPGSTLAINDTASITITVLVQAHGSYGTFYNTAFAYGVSAEDSMPTMDLSNDGDSIDPNHNGIHK